MCFNLQGEAPCSSRLVHPGCKMTFFQWSQQVLGLALIGSAWITCLVVNQSPWHGAHSPPIGQVCVTYTPMRTWDLALSKTQGIRGNASARRKVKVLLPGKGKKDIGKAETADVCCPLKLHSGLASLRMHRHRSLWPGAPGKGSFPVRSSRPRPLAQYSLPVPGFPSSKDHWWQERPLPSGKSSSYRQCGLARGFQHDIQIKTQGLKMH